MRPYALSLLDYLSGDEKAETTIHRDDGRVDSLPASFFFREDFSGIERRALELCEGRVLDVGAGAGPHSLALQERGYEVCALDISPEACEVMRSRGVRDVRCGDIFDFHEAFDTLLIMDKGIGMVETLPGLDRFLKHVREIGKRILLDSIDVTKTKEEDHLQYHERMRRAGRYFGEVRLRFEYKDIVGPEFGWLHVDPDMLAEHASDAGWKCAIEIEEDVDYLARLF
jgi:SAM-dependent methyltransferase